MLGLAVALALTAAPNPAPAGNASAPKPSARPKVEAAFMYDLATPSGLLEVSWPTLRYDRANDEIFLVHEGFVRIFDKSGMETHRFGDDGSMGAISRVAVLEDGELVVVTTIDGKRTFLRCDFRGTPIEELKLTGLPAEGFENFEPDQLVYQDGRLYFAERGGMRVVVTDVNGVHRQSWNLRDVVAAAIEGDTDRKPAANMDGFNVDARGNILFTMSTMFSGAVMSPSGRLRLFGTRGSMPGKFNIIGGIDVDENGYIYVADRLRSVISVWDRDLTFLAEFGHRGGHVGSLLTPFEIAVGNGKVFVTQAGKKGVRVFRVGVHEPPPPEGEPATPEPPQEEPERPRPRPRHPYPAAVG